MAILLCVAPVCAKNTPIDDDHVSGLVDHVSADVANAAVQPDEKPVEADVALADADDASSSVENQLASDEQLDEQDLAADQVDNVSVDDDATADDEDSALIEIDAIQAVVFSHEGTEIVTQSDVYRSSMAGGMNSKARSLDDILFERLVLLDAKKHKIEVGEKEVDRYLARVMSENGLRPEDLKKVFAAEGFTLEEGKKHLRDMQTVSTMLNYKIQSNLIIPKRQVEQYYEDNPVMLPAQYAVEIAHEVFNPGVSREEQEKQLKTRSHGLAAAPDLDWSEPFWINATDLAEDKQFITQMQAGDVELVKVATGYDVYRLHECKPETLKSFDDRYVEIVDILRMPKYEQLVTEYRTHLFGTSSIVRYG